MNDKILFLEETQEIEGFVAAYGRNKMFYFLLPDNMLPSPLRPAPVALLRFVRTPPPTFVTLAAVVFPAFEVLPAAALPVFDMLPAADLFILLEVMLFDYIGELLLAFPVAASIEEVEPAHASKMQMAIATDDSRRPDAIFAIS